MPNARTRSHPECQQIGASAKAARRWQKLDPARAEAAAAVALASVRLYQPVDAGVAILRTHELGGDEALIKLIAELSDAGGSAIVLDTLRPMLESPKVSDQVFIAGVELALENFDFTTAHKLADRVLANEPASGEARAQLARVLTAEGNAVAAIAISQEAAALDPESQRFAYADTCCGSTGSTKRARNSKACARMPRYATRRTCVSASSPTSWAT